MELTLTKEELEGYAAKLSQWYDERSMFVLQRVNSGPQYEYRNTEESVKAAFNKFESEHPRPTWKDLL